MTVLQPRALDPRVLEHLAQTLEAAGFDLFQPFDYGWYRRAVEPAWHVPLPAAWSGVEHPLAVVVGNTRALWTPFQAWMNADLGRKSLTDPLDTYSASVLERAMGGLEVPGVWRGAWEKPPRRVAIQKAAEVSGLAVLSPASLCVRTDVGPWLALRALLVLGVEWTGVYEKPRASSPCVGCEAPCVPPRDRAMRLLEAHPEEPSPVERFWETWLAIRDACPVGCSSRYSDAQVRFHYQRRL